MGWLPRLLLCVSLSLATLAERPCDSPLSIRRENIIFCLHNRMAREPAFGVVRLRRYVSLVGGPECVGCGVIFELGPSPSAAVRESLAILQHESNAHLGVRDTHVKGRLLAFLRL